MNIRNFVLILTAFFLLLVSCVDEEVPTVEPLPTFAPPTVTATAQSGTATRVVTAVSTPAPTQTATIANNAPLPSATPSPACGPPAGWVIYTVQVNDTLFSLARRTNTTVEQIQHANCLNDTLIYAGQPLYLPFIPPSPPVATISSSPTSTTDQLPSPMATSTSTSTATATVESPDAPGPSDPHLEINPTSGSAGTIFTISIIDFDSNEAVTVQIVFVDTFEVVSTIKATIDKNGSIMYASQDNSMVGNYVVEAFGKVSHASGEFIIVEPLPSTTPTPTEIPTVEVTNVPSP